MCECESHIPRLRLQGVDIFHESYHEGCPDSPVRFPADQLINWSDATPSPNHSPGYVNICSYPLELLP